MVDEPDDIEILDVAVAPATTSTESITDQGSNRWLPLVIVGILGLGIAGLSVSGGGGETTPPTTTPPPSITTPTTAPPDLDPDPSDLDAADLDVPGVRIGDGPQLDWQLVAADTNAVDFRWFDDGFLGLDADGSAALIRPDSTGGSLTVLAGTNDVPPVRSSEPVVGEPADNPAVLRFLGGPDVVIDPIAAPASDLVDQIVRVSAERIGDRVLVLQRSALVLDTERLRERTGLGQATVFGMEVTESTIFTFSAVGEESVTIADTDLGPDDLDALRRLERPTTQLVVARAGESTPQQAELSIDRIDWIDTIGDEFVVGGSSLHRSSDGITWERASSDTPQFGGLLPPGPDGVLTGLTFVRDEGFLARSRDAGRQWMPMARPLEETWRITSAAPIVAMTGWQGPPGPDALDSFDLLTPEWELVIEEDPSTFTLSRRGGAVVLSGSADDPASGFRFAPGSDDIWFIDPASDTEIARFPLDYLADALATSRTSSGDPQLVAFADLDAAGDDGTQEWSLVTIDQLFGPNALAVELIAGDGWFLADVLTTDGRDLYTAAVGSG